MTLIIEEEVNFDFLFDYKEIADKVIRECLSYEDFPYESEVSLTITDNNHIQSINKEFRSIDSPTDVLSFPMIDYPSAGDFSELNDDMDIFNPETGEAILGDIVLSVDRIKSQAKEYGHSEKREYAFLIAHSMLHLMGYDHEEEHDRTIMENKQKEILANLGITREEED